MTTIVNNEPRLAITTTEGMFFYYPSEIIRLEASSNYTYIYFTNRKPLLISKVLGTYEDLLKEAGFVRTHRSHMVNKQYIQRIDKTGNIYMSDSSRAEISRRKKKEVMQALTSGFTNTRAAA